jgi:hypothetical protein
MTDLDILRREIELETRLKADKRDTKARLELASIYWNSGRINSAKDFAGKALDHLEYAITLELRDGCVDDIYGTESADDEKILEVLQGTQLLERAKTIFNCRTYINKVKSTVSPVGIWDHVRYFVSNIQDLDDKYIALGQIAAHPDELTESSLLFLKDMAQFNDFDSHDTMEAIRWYEKHGANIATEIRSQFFRRVTRYHTEFNMIERLWAGSTVLDDERFEFHERFDYVLGQVASVLSLEEKAQLILDRNALKLLIGRQNYESLVKKAIDPRGLNIGDELHDRLVSYATAYDISRDLPIHESKLKVLSKNPTFLAQIDIGDITLTTFVKLYKKEVVGGDDAATIEEKLLTSLGKRNIRVPSVVTSTEIPDYKVLMLRFVDGQNLYSILHTDITKDVKNAIFQNAIDQLAAIQKTVPEIADKVSITLEDLSIDHSFITDYLRDPFMGCYGQAGENVFSSMEYFLSLIVDFSKEDNLYYKDSNPRNVMVEKDKKQVTHVDFEYGVKAMGELDLAKMLRNGLDYQNFDWTLNYKSAEKTGKDFNEKRKMAERYLRKLRYLNGQQETTSVKRWNKAHNRGNGKVQKMRWDLGILFTHLYYVAWISAAAQKSKTEDGTLTNRIRYHMLESKVQLDHMIHDRKYEIDRKKIYKLRKSLDEIKC